MSYSKVVLLPTIVLVACSSADAMMDAARTANRTKLIQLQVGMDRDVVLRTMGTTPVKIRDGSSVVGTVNNPYRNEMYQASGHRFEVIYYYTDMKSRDGGIADDELTPLVLKDGILDGWGWSYLRDVSAKYEIRIR